MPSWKKVIVSGSDASLNSLYAPSITGSLQGTSSFAVTASYATTSQNASDILIYVKNTTGQSIPKGTVVRINGATGDNALIATASYESDAVSANTLGITYETIADQAFGNVMTEGKLLGISTNLWTTGQLLFLGANGAITGSAPLAPLHAVRLGQVLRVQQNNGSMYVRIDNGYELNELHDVTDTTTTASYGDLLVKSGSVWTNSKQMSGSYGLTGSLTIDSNGATGLILDTDLASSTVSSRIFFKNSSSYTDFSIRNSNQLLIIAASASAGISSGTGRMYISSSGDVSIGTGYSPSSTRNAILQLSGSVNIEEGFAYKQDGYDILYTTRGSVGTSYDNIIGGVFAASQSAYIDQMTAYGYFALAQSSGSDQTAVGYAAGRYNTGSSQTLIGWAAGFTANGNNQTAIGKSAGYLNSASFQTAIGVDAGYLNSGSNQTAVGYGAGFQNTATQQTAVGLSAGEYNTGIAQTAIGQQAGDSNKGSTQTVVGYAAGFQNSGSIQVAIGSQAGRDNTGSFQVAVGHQAGRQNTQDNQTTVGYEAGYQNTGTEQSAFGWRSGYQNSGANMTAVGSAAGFQNTGSGLVAVGTDTGRTNKGTLNTFIGYQAGYFTTGSTVNTGSIQSVFLGASTTAGSGNRTNQIVIGHNASGIGSNSVVLGNSSITTTALRGNVGIGITSPSASLHATGSAIISGSMVIGSSSLGPNENTLTLGARDTAGEGGQLGLNASGGTYTSASMIDVWQNKFRVLRGTNAGSDATRMQIDLHTGQLNLATYTSTTAQVGTIAGILGFDSSGNILTTTSAGSLSGGATNYITRWAGPSSLTTGSIYDTGTDVGIGNQAPSYKLDVTGDIRATGAIYANANGAMYFRGGDDAALYDINAANTMGIYGVQTVTEGAIKLGSEGAVLYGSGSKLGIGTTTPNSASLHVNGNVFATSFTGSIQGTASYSTIKTSGTTIYSADPAAGPSFSTVNGIFLGSNAGSVATNAQYSNFIGRSPGDSATNAQYSNFIGFNVGVSATNASYSNIFGYQAGFNASDASYSNLFGYQAGQTVGTNNIGSNNIIIGTNLTLPNGTANAINIGGIIFGTGTNSNTAVNPVSSSMVDGRIGIGTTTPNATLDVSGSFNVSGSYESPSGNIIDSNALIQAGLLYLSNNF